MAFPFLPPPGHEDWDEEQTGLGDVLRTMVSSSRPPRANPMRQWEYAGERTVRRCQTG